MLLNVLLLVIAMIIPAAGAMMYFVIYPGGVLSQVSYTGAKLFILIWPLFAVLFIEKKQLGLFRINKLNHLKSIPLGMISGLLISCVLYILYSYTSLGDEVRQYKTQMRSVLRENGIIDYYFAAALFLSVIHSLLEEYYWRWYVFGELSRLVRPTAAYLIAGLAFALHHYVVLNAYFSFPLVVLFGTCVAVGGIFWCWLYRKQSSIAGTWISHLLVDMMLFYIGYDIIFGG
ncbi:MAG: CPBP family intramembrane metalloprotease [Planctomycetes bacterium]|nr:CPBP family intramembrane metalloprotease [Planctomycetota bacterium]